MLLSFLLVFKDYKEFVAALLLFIIPISFIFGYLFYKSWKAIDKYPENKYPLIKRILFGKRILNIAYEEELNGSTYYIPLYFKIMFNRPIVMLTILACSYLSNINASWCILGSFYITLTVLQYAYFGKYLQINKD